MNGEYQASFVQASTSFKAWPIDILPENTLPKCELFFGLVQSGDFLAKSVAKFADYSKATGRWEFADCTDIGNGEAAEVNLGSLDCPGNFKIVPGVLIYDRFPRSSLVGVARLRGLSLRAGLPHLVGTRSGAS